MCAAEDEEQSDDECDLRRSESTERCACRAYVVVVLLVYLYERHQLHS